MTNKTKPNVKWPTAHCQNPACKYKWPIRVEAPKKCPVCFQRNVKVKGVR